MKIYLILALLIPSNLAVTPHRIDQQAPGSTRQAPELDRYLTRLPKIKRAENAQASYEFVCDYLAFAAAGNLIQKERISGLYTTGLPSGKVKWSNVRIAQARSLDGPFQAGALLPYMEGFSYNPSTADTFSDTFFAGFPAGEVKAKNLVWDVLGFETFAKVDLDRLELNVPSKSLHDQSMTLPGTGSFTNRDVELTWIGLSKQNGSICVLIRYEAFFNPLTISVPGFQAKGLSHYWGDLWVSLQTGQIELATLAESVTLEALIAGQPNKAAMSVVRRGTFRRQIY